MPDYRILYQFYMNGSISGGNNDRLSMIHCQLIFAFVMTPKQTNINDREHSGLLHYVMPFSREFSIQLTDSPGISVHHQYSKYNGADTIIMLREEYRFKRYHHTLLHAMQFEERDLKVIFCRDETHFSGEKMAYFEGYPYIRFPSAYTDYPKWQYWFCENIRISNISKLGHYVLDGETCKALFVYRTFEYVEPGLNSHFLHFEECYVAGYGIQSKKLINN